MSSRPTIPDLAKAAGLSVSTVNRVIDKSSTVRQQTRERVLRAAEEIGFYGLAAIEHSVLKGREAFKLGVLLLQRRRTFYRNLGDELERQAREHPSCNIELQLEYLNDLNPDNVSANLLALGKSCDAVAVVAAEHPMVSDAIDKLQENGVPVIALIAPLSARGNVGFVGLDSWKIGRTAAWTFDNIVREPRKIGIFVGNHRYRNQELQESGFRSYFREHNTEFTLLEPRVTFESAAVARELVEKMLAEHQDLSGIYVSGGGIIGVLAALREVPRRDDFVVVGYELFEATRTALIDGLMTLVISHPMEAFAREAIATMIKAKKAGPEAGTQSVVLDFDLYTSENV